MQLGAEAVFVDRESSNRPTRRRAPRPSSTRPRTTTTPRNCWRRAGCWAMPCRASISPNCRSRNCCRPEAGDEAGGRALASGRFCGARGGPRARRREPVYVREREQFRDIDGLVIPGGESTTMLKLLHQDGLMDALAEFGRHKPVFGTCAGAILMAAEVWNPPQESLALMDIAVERNAYGRQIDSRVTVLEPEPEFQKRTAPASSRRSSFARRLSAASTAAGTCWRAIGAIPCWSSRAATWWPRSIPS